MWNGRHDWLLKKSADKQTDRQTDRYTNRRTDRQIDKQTYLSIAAMYNCHISIIWFQVNIHVIAEGFDQLIGWSIAIIKWICCHWERRKGSNNHVLVFWYWSSVKFNLVTSIRKIAKYTALPLFRDCYSLVSLHNQPHTTKSNRWFCQAI